MFIKFKENILTYKYLIMFDLASRITGVCIWDINAKKPLDLAILSVSEHEDLPVMGLYNEIDTFFKKLFKKGIKKEDIVVSFEAVPAQIRAGKSSTIQTFVALAKAHAILDLYLFMNNIATYDNVGIYPITTHSYFKNLTNRKKDDKITKDDIKMYVVKEYSLSPDITYDESDAVFLAKTFFDVKWNRDINDKIKEIKRHIKTLKAPHAIAMCNNEIDMLNQIKN